MSDRTFYRRQFLNTEESGGVALVIADVQELSVSKDGTHASFEAQLTIGDCNRTVVLDFGVYAVSDAENIRAKLKRFKSAFLAFERAVLEQVDAYDGLGL